MIKFILDFAVVYGGGGGGGGGQISGSQTYPYILWYTLI